MSFEWSADEKTIRINTGRQDASRVWPDIALPSPSRNQLPILHGREEELDV